MKTSKSTSLKFTALAAVITLSTVNANAALYDRGNGMIYDSTKNITWLQDANYAFTSGHIYATNNGRMNYFSATQWAANLVYGGYTDWRLASAGLDGTNRPCTRPMDVTGSLDCSYNNTRSEIGHLFIELGNKAAFSTSGVWQPDAGLTNTTFVDAGTGHTVSFLNLQKDVYWAAERYAPLPWQPYIWTYDLYYGGQTYDAELNQHRAWAVRDGDVAAVPVPAAGWLLGSALVGLAGLRRRKAR